MSWQANEPLTHDNAHSRPVDLDPRVNGPFLDDVRREQEQAYREQRMKAEQSKDVAVDDTQDLEPVEEEEDNASDGE
jgi:hypothetical protein